MDTLGRAHERSYGFCHVRSGAYAAGTDTRPGRALTDDVPAPRDHARMDHERGHRALRRGRVSQQGGIYHVTFATVDRTPWFRNHVLAVAACRTFERSAEDAGAELVCWVLMPDHFHALLRVHGSQDLSRCVQRLKGRATVACRAVCREPAAIWARGFHDHAMRRDEDLMTTARYIIDNPRRARLVDHAMRYPYWDADWL